ncbi:MAG: NAD(P)/FAD-dependent oxidoreductase [Zoogloea sp.]|nr:NAD(P)/FAD-dependent oxidoreductase [Zoogloea sp.]
MADRAVGIDAVNRIVTTQNGSRIPYDKLVLAPGIDFDAVPGLDTAVLPHAWQAGPQTLALKGQLDAVPAGGTFVMSIPPAPYRCPPGPYERACLLADSLLRRRRAGRVIVLDANNDVVAEPHTFHTAFRTTYASVIEYRPNSVVSRRTGPTRRSIPPGDRSVPMAPTSSRPRRPESSLSRLVCSAPIPQHAGRQSIH